MQRHKFDPAIGIIFPEAAWDTNYLQRILETVI